MYKFRNVTATDVLPPPHDYLNLTSTDFNSTMVTDGGGEKLTDLQIAWNSYLSIASMIPNVTFLKLNAIFGHHFPTQPRLVAANVIIILMCIFTAVMADLNTDAWQDIFLYLTLVSVVIINIMVAIYQVIYYL